VNFNTHARIFFRIFLCTLCLSSILATAAFHSARAQSPQDKIPPTRTISVAQTTTFYDWRISDAQNGGELCKMVLDHAGPPSETDLYQNCEPRVPVRWKSDLDCKTSAPRVALANCASLALRLAGSEEKQSVKEITYPRPTVWVSFKDCAADMPQGRCNHLPVIRLDGVEPIPGQTITAIHVLMGEKQIDCLSNFCEIYPKETGEQGLVLQFWADSSLGDQSILFDAYYRVVPGKSSSPGAKPSEYWFTDLISTQNQGENPQACSLAWSAFPPLETDTPLWLSTPQRPQELATNHPYVYLASSLISNKVIDGQACGAGMPANGQPADAAQVSCARDAVATWQNRFDSEILSAAQSTGVPAQVIKRVFARESQLWPGQMASGEVGLSHLTEPGVDTLMLWDPQFYSSWCPNALSQQECALGYGNLSPVNQALVRGSLMSRLKNDCPSCQYGISLPQANYEINVFTHVLQANCAQTGRMLSNITHKTPRALASYTELWKLTVANYNAGPGCIAAAVQQAYQNTGAVNWKDVSTYLPAYCQMTKDYIEEITSP
jgi:hypothetical protein